MIADLLYWIGTLLIIGFVFLCVPILFMLIVTAHYYLAEGELRRSLRKAGEMRRL